MERTERGFRVFASDDNIRVQESSRALEGAHCWIFDSNKSKGGSVQLSVDEAELVILGLQHFVREAKADELTEPARRT